jgi:hypothetical protein
MLRALLLSTGVLALAACGPPPGPNYGGGPGPGPAAAGGCPAWNDGATKSPRHPEEMYLTAVGTAPAGGSCENDAYAALSKIFNAQVSQVQTEFQGYRSQINAAGGNMREEATAITSLTRVFTEKVLKGAQIVERGTCTGNLVCLAAMDRAVAAGIIEQELASIDAQIKAKIDEGDSKGGNNPTFRFMSYSAAMEMLAQRMALYADLKVIHAARASRVATPYDPAMLIKKLAGAASRVRVGLKLVGYETGKVQTCLAEGLAKKGLKVSEGTSDVDAMIHGNLKYKRAGYVANSVMVRADFNLRVTNMKTGRTIIAYSEDIKVGRETLEQSLQLAVFKLCEMAVESLPKKIFEGFKR